MRIAFLCHRIPYPPNKGDKLRAFHQLRGMAERGHEIDLFTLVDTPGDLQHIQSLSLYCRSVTVRALNPLSARLRSLMFLPTKKPLTLPYFYSAALASDFQHAMRTRTYDRIFIYCSAMAQYARNTGGVPVITDLVDVDSDKWRQYAAYAFFPMSWIYHREAACLAQFERSVCLMSAASVVATEREARLLGQICPGAAVHVMRNGGGEACPSPPGTAARSADPTVVFTGDMAYFPNAHAVEYFAREVLPLLQNVIPAARFLIVGRNPGRRVRNLAGIAGVEVTGSVPDVRTYLARAHVSVAPFLISAGIPNKILEAMNAGLPVVATERAVQGLTPDVAAAVTTAGNAQEMASAIADLLGDCSLAERKAEEGRRAVAASYNWERALAELLDLLESPFGPAQRRDWQPDCSSCARSLETNGTQGH